MRPEMVKTVPLPPAVEEAIRTGSARVSADRAAHMAEQRDGGTGIGCGALRAAALAVKPKPKAQQGNGGIMAAPAQ